MLLNESILPVLNTAEIYPEFPHCSCEVNLQAEDKHTYSSGDNRMENVFEKGKNDSH